MKSAVLLFLFLSFSLSLCRLFSSNIAPFLPQRYLSLHSPSPFSSLSQKEFVVRQVPGDGSCLFNALSVCFQALSAHYPSSSSSVSPSPPRTPLSLPYDHTTKFLSNFLRTAAVSILQSNSSLILSENETISSSELLEIGSSEFNLTGTDYCQLMLRHDTWGGGPEIIALCNLLQCPIHIYQAKAISPSPLSSLSSKNINQTNPFCLERICCFGQGVYNSNQTLSLLFVPGQFPHVTPEELEQLKPNHFMALFEIEEVMESEIARINRQKEYKQEVKKSQKFSPFRLFSLGQGGNWRKRVKR